MAILQTVRFRNPFRIGCIYEVNTSSQIYSCLNHNIIFVVEKLQLCGVNLPRNSFLSFGRKHYHNDETNCSDLNFKE